MMAVPEGSRTTARHTGEFGFCGSKHFLRRSPLAGLLVLLFCGSLGAVPTTPERIAYCEDCHGPDGRSEDPNIPIIAGQSAFSLTDQLLAFRYGDRPCLTTAFRRGDGDRDPVSMCEIANSIEERELEALAGHFAEFEFRPAEQGFDPELAQAGKQVHEELCERCHTEGGSVPADDSAILAGQWMPYLRRSLDDFTSGERAAPVKMQPKLEALSERDVNALVHFYASAGAQ